MNPNHMMDCNTSVKRTLIISSLALLLSLSAWPARAQDEPAPDANDELKGVGIAVLMFEANDPGHPDLGAQISDALEATLAGLPQLTVVTRKDMTPILAEHHLNLSGLVEAEHAVKVGKLVGAKILVTGRAFSLGERTFITAKLIGTETSLVTGVLVRSDANEDLAELVMQLSEKVKERLMEEGNRLIAAEHVFDDPLPALVKKLAAKQRPVMAVVVTERHRGAANTATNDPACETEIKRLLIEAGVTVKDVKDNELAAWARQVGEEQTSAWPRSLEGVDFVVTGQAFSEMAARFGDLVSCSARAEINVVGRKDGRIVLAERITTRAVDLSDEIAGKAALQNAGLVLGLRTLTHLADTLPEAEKHNANP